MNSIQSDLIIPDEVLINKIYLLRNQKVMLDRDLAALYGLETRRLREQVKRNLANFPKNFMFQPTEKEVNTMVLQDVIPSKRSLGGYLPFVFTEHGVLMLANVLRSEQAIRVSIKIIEIFVRLREMLLENETLKSALKRIETKNNNNAANIEVIFNYIEALSAKPDKIPPRKKIGYTLTEKK